MIWVTSRLAEVEWMLPVKPFWSMIGRAPGMVKMGVGQNNGRNGRRIERQLLVFLVSLVAPPLEHAAVDLQQPAVDFQKMLGTR